MRREVESGKWEVEEALPSALRRSALCRAQRRT
ncbi:hypothetical protein Dxin01_00547 [Deinococcus xinjiangensis]|uniref:Uncharacterized protein n=1 Tax=Deinococcus xinjiangensis TaxID=457454 RepID=A0ABP9V6C4_9DEIO